MSEKRKKGRPRKPEEHTVKRPRGRPRNEKNQPVEEVKRPRGRPQTKTTTFKDMNFKAFWCCYANSVAQVYVLEEDFPHEDTGPFSGWNAGDCVVIWIRNRDGEWVSDPFPFPEKSNVHRFTSQSDAVKQAEYLWNQTPWEDQYGYIEEHPRRNIMYANRSFDVWYAPHVDGTNKHSKKPFIVNMTEHASPLRDKRGVVRRYASLLSAINIAIAEDNSRQERTWVPV